jgi:uncharacterized protein
MAQSIVSKGKNVMDAVNIGLGILGAEKGDVSIEIIQQESRSFFRSKPAVVKLTKTKTENEKETSPPLEEVIAEELTFRVLEQSIEPEKNVTKEREQPTFPASMQTEGKVWVKDGQLVGKPSPMQYPTITVGKGINLYRNGERIEGSVVVTKDVKFEIHTEDEIIETIWDMEMDSQKLTVTLHVEPGKKISRYVKDTKPESHLFLEAHEEIEWQNTLTYEDVLLNLESLKVIHGFHHTEIMKAIETKEAGSFIIAKGKEPTEGQNGYIELKSDVDLKEEGPKRLENGNVDYRELKYIPTVNKGQVIAVIHPPTPGLPGVTVTNEPLPAKQTYPLIVRAEKGTLLMENDTKIVAMEPGRPMIEQSSQLVKVSIMDKMIHHGDVDISTGNIRFNGDVDIIGNINNEMKVEATGMVTVTKNVDMSTINAKDSVIIHRNIIGSSISSGKDNLFISELLLLVDELEQDVAKLIQSMDQLSKVPALKLSDYESKGLLPLIKLLLEKRFRNIPLIVKQFKEVITKGRGWLDEEWEEFAVHLRDCFLSTMPSKWHTFEQLQVLLSIIQQFQSKYRLVNNEKNFIELLYALNSSIYCSGDVTIFGQGCFNTKIQSGGNLKINGVLRGGVVYARLGAFIKEAGAVGGVSTRIIVPAGQKIMIDLAREGTTIQIGKYSHTFDQDIHHIEATLDENGRISFSSGFEERYLHV